MSQHSNSSRSITVDVTLYGPIASYGGGTHFANLSMALKQGADMGDLYAQLQIPHDARGYVFINSVLCDAPGLKASVHHNLQTDDHIGIFSDTHMWPYQYRDGVRMSDELRKVLREKGSMHHSYDSASLNE